MTHLFDTHSEKEQRNDTDRGLLMYKTGASVDCICFHDLMTMTFYFIWLLSLFPLSKYLSPLVSTFVCLLVTTIVVEYVRTMNSRYEKKRSLVTGVRLAETHTSL